jgi:hypothetical protein
MGLEMNVACFHTTQFTAEDSTVSDRYPQPAAQLSPTPKEAFADSFKKIYEGCQPCVVKDDDYLEGQ